MGLYKEIDAYLREKQQRQGNVFPRGVNVGVKGILIRGLTDPLCGELKDIFEGTKKDYRHYLGGLKQMRSKGLHTDGSLHYSIVTVYLPWEQEHGMVRCTRWDICYNNDARGRIYITFKSSNCAVEADSHVLG